jgi:hypothetical protein
MEQEEANKIQEERDQRRETYKETLAEIKHDATFGYNCPDCLRWFDDSSGDIGEEVQDYIMNARKGEHYLTSENCIEYSALASFLRRFRNFEFLLRHYNRDMLADTKPTYDDLLWVVMEAIAMTKAEIAVKYEHIEWEKRQEEAEE